MRKTALIIGNSEYGGASYLKNPVNDAGDISALLKKLGFSVITRLNAKNEDVDRELQKFEENLNKSDIGLFYFAGHGVQVSGINYLVAIDSKTTDEIALKHSSTSLNKVLDIMDKSNNETNIVILDACRNNPFERAWNRDTTYRGFANVFAPKGTIISFSTSPGQYASDGVTNNSPFAYALLTHLQTSNISIEELFKRVRETVMASTSDKQISWEHTSLIGNFQFNSGNYISVETGYSEQVVADSTFKGDGSQLSNIIEGLKSHNWYKQNPAIYEIYNLDASKLNKDSEFILGRNILQVADGGENKANDILREFDLIRKFNINGENHLLNGILFEIYFDCDGKLRQAGFKSSCIDKVLDNAQTIEFKSSIDFIREQLLPFREDLFVIPNIPPESISLNLVFEKEDEKSSRLTEILFEGRNILIIDDTNNFFGYQRFRYSDLFKDISDILCIPKKQIVITNNLGLKDDDVVFAPFRFEISKINK